MPCPRPARGGLTAARARGRVGGRPPALSAQQGKRHIALDLYLLAHLLASKTPWDVELAPKVWARLLALAETDSSTTLLTRQWKWLEAEQLIRTERTGRARRVFLLDESANAKPYQHPGITSEESSAEGSYFQLSTATGPPACTSASR